ncbi:MAG TPA: hypothetical protein VGM65_14790 [Candidatus Udaeobacter sp.]|jgi:hypothetical protein
MKTQNSLPKSVIIIALFIGAAIGMAGCADYVDVGVAHAGYDAAYYTPGYQPAYAAYYTADYEPTYSAYYAADYQPVYSGYFYDGVPWWGASYYYSGNKIVLKDVDKYVNVNRNVYSGGRRFVRRGAERGRVITTTHPVLARPAITRPATKRAAIAHRRVVPVRR